MSTLKNLIPAISLCFVPLLIVSLLLLLSGCVDPPADENGGSQTSTTDPATSGPVKYDLIFRTSCDGEAGTSSKMYALLKGERGDSKTFKLDDLTKIEFQSCSRDIFTVEVPNDLGAIKGMEVWHDNSTEDASWMVEIITVVNKATGQKFRFPCGKWFASDKDDGKIRREFFDWRECK